MADLPPSGPQIGADEWVAREGQLRPRTGMPAIAERLLDRVPPAVRFAVVVGGAAIFGIATSHEYYQRVGFNTLYCAPLVLFVLVVVVLWLVNHSRTGRAWRSLREDPLAAQLLGMPINPLKLMAFAFGAAVAGLTGTMFAALEVNIFPSNFYLDVLITLYAIVVLGGAGSMAG